MSFQYYNQFRDDEDLFPRSVSDEDDLADEDCLIEDLEEDEDECGCARGCKYCLGTEW